MSHESDVAVVRVPPEILVDAECRFKEVPISGVGRPSRGRASARAGSQDGSAGIEAVTGIGCDSASPSAASGRDSRNSCVNVAREIRSAVIGVKQRIRPRLIFESANPGTRMDWGKIPIWTDNEVRAGCAADVTAASGAIKSRGDEPEVLNRLDAKLWKKAVAQAIERAGGISA